MAKPYKIPDFRKMYPEASEEVIAVLRTTERKMQYQEYDLKRARNIVDPKTGEVMTVPSREDSYERLQEMAVQFPEEDDGVEDQILQKLEFERLHKAILTLSKEEQWLIHEAFLMIIDHVTVYPEKRVQFCLKNGLELEESLEEGDMADGRN